jgi:hypothetical protein
MRETVPSLAVEGRAMIALPPRSGRAAVEVHLPADAGVELAAERVGADLSGQVDLQGDVDRHHGLCCWPITNGSLTYSVGWKAKVGLLCM